MQPVEKGQLPDLETVNAIHGVIICENNFGGGTTKRFSIWGQEGIERNLQRLNECLPTIVDMSSFWANLEKASEEDDLAACERRIGQGERNTQAINLTNGNSITKRLLIWEDRGALGWTILKLWEMLLNYKRRSSMVNAMWIGIWQESVKNGGLLAMYSCKSSITYQSHPKQCGKEFLVVP